MASRREIERRAAAVLGSGAVAALRRRLIVAEEYLVPALRLADAHASAGGPTWMYRFDLELPSGPLAGCAPHTVDLSPTWNRASPYDALPGRPAAAIHEAILRFVKTHDAGWPRYETDRRMTALIGDRIEPAEHPDRAMLDLFRGGTDRPAAE